MKLKNYINLINGYAFDSSEMSNSGVPIIKIKELKNNLIKFTNDTFYYNGDMNLQKYRIRYNDIVVALTGNPPFKGNFDAIVGRSALYRYSYDSLLNQRLCKIESNSNLLLNRYLFYWISNSKKVIELANMCSGSANQANISSNDILNLDIILPSIEIQQHIVDTIGSIDDLIEKYEEVINNLESLILIKYKQSITNNFKIVKLKDIVEVIDNRGKTPQLSKDVTNHPIIEVAHIANNNMIIDIDNCSKYVSDEVYLSSFRAGHLKSGDVLISTVGTIGEVGFNFDDGLSIAQNVVALRSKYSYLLYPYLILNKNELLNLNIGGVQPSIKIPHLLNLEFPIPEKYDSSIEFLYFQINSISKKLLQLKKIKSDFLNKYFNN